MGEPDLEGYVAHFPTWDLVYLTRLMSAAGIVEEVYYAHGILANIVFADLMEVIDQGE